MGSAFSECKLGTGEVLVVVQGGKEMFDRRLRLRLIPGIVGRVAEEMKPAGKEQVEQLALAGMPDDWPDVLFFPGTLTPEGRMSFFTSQAAYQKYVESGRQQYPSTGLLFVKLDVRRKMKVPSPGIKPDGEAISAEEVASAITQHAQATGTRRDVVSQMVDRGELVPVAWPETVLLVSSKGAKQHDL